MVAPLDIHRDKCLTEARVRWRDARPEDAISRALTLVPYE